jgi:hypothetical protein
MGRLRPDSARPVNSTIEGHAAKSTRITSLTLTYVEALLRALFFPRQKRQNPQPVANKAALAACLRSIRPTTGETRGRRLQGRYGSGSVEMMLPDPTSESRYRRQHGDHRQDRLQMQGSIVYAPLAKRPRKNRLILSEAISQIRRLNIPLLIACNSRAGARPDHPISGAAREQRRTQRGRRQIKCLHFIAVSSLFAGAVYGFA